MRITCIGRIANGKMHLVVDLMELNRQYEIDKVKKLARRGARLNEKLREMVEEAPAGDGEEADTEDPAPWYMQENIVPMHWCGMDQKGIKLNACLEEQEGSRCSAGCEMHLQHIRNINREEGMSDEAEGFGI